MVKFKPEGKPRFAHQIAALQRLIETRGKCALLLDPGLGKTAVTFDYLSLLTLHAKQVVSGTPELRVLVIAPKGASDTWALQAEEYAHRDVNVWCEVLGGSIEQKSRTLMSRGPKPYRPRALVRRKDAKQLPYRGLHLDRAQLLYTRPVLDDPRGPGDLQGKPRLLMAITNLDTFASRERRGAGTVADSLMAAVERFQPDVIVVDELHKIKGATSNTSRLIGRIGQLSPRRIGLTGTVMPHSPMDVFAQWRFINPEAFGEVDHKTGKKKRATFEGFKRRYGVMGGFMGREVISFCNLDEMETIMAENAIVARKEDALDLPQMTDTVVSYPLSSKEAKAYEDMRKDLVSLFDAQDAAGAGQTSVTASNRLIQMLRLRQLTSGHMKDDQGVVQTIGTSQTDAITHHVHDTLEGEKRIVIFAVFTHEIQELQRSLTRKGTEVHVITGHTPQADRLRIRRRFGGKDPARIVLVAQVKTMAVAVNELVTASHAIFATLSQQRDDVTQARDRLNRIGQTKPCTFWYFLARGTVDEAIYKSHKTRTNLEAAILENIKGTAE